MLKYIMQLRILSGCYKNRSIKLHHTFKDRPTLVTVRRTIFDILINLMGGVAFSFLDVFAGSGAMGIEALSRGAGKVVFFDLNVLYLKTIEENLLKMPNVVGQFSTLKANALRPPNGNPMEVIFLDPPYDKYYIIEDVVEKLRKYNWINDSSIIITESFYKNSINLKNYYKFREKKISSTLISFFSTQPEEVFSN
jgi:16S rRNA (guanine966-N2)-methyltransferase